MLLRSGLGLVALGGAVLGGVALLGSVAGAWWYLYQVARDVTKGNRADVVAILPDERGTSLRVERQALARVRLAWDRDARDWALEVPDVQGGALTVRGEAAVRAAALLLPAVNRFGGSNRLARDAVALLEHHEGPEALFRAFASEWDGTASGYRDLPGGRIEFVPDGPRGFLSRLAPARRLALEMAAHEDVERRALDGELEELERAWREAEEIAAIADDLLLPDGVRQFVEKHRVR
jgi:hypothetical protein